MKKLMTICLVGVAFLMGLGGPALADSGWNIQTVDSAGDVGCQGISLALDAGGNAHISYYDGGTNRDLKYAAWNGLSWDIQTLDAEGDVGWYPSLALDSSDYPHIIYGEDYLSNYYDCYKYAYKDSSSWQVETVPDQTNAGWMGSLALDSKDHAHMSYMTWKLLSRITLWYGVREDSSWSFEPVDETYNSTGCSNSVALDSSDVPHISYTWAPFYGGLFYLNYAVRTDSGWVTQSVDTAGDLGWGNSLALDSTDHPHISYLDYTNGNLKYAKWDGSEWHIQTVDNSGDVGSFYTSLALDGGGFPHIVYYDGTNQDLKYASWDGSGWAIETVDSTGDVGQYASLALDAGGNAHISYYDATSGDLKYAHHVLTVDIDIKPGSDDNTISLSAQGGLIPVAILSTETFDATDVDPGTVELAGEGVAVRGKGIEILANEQDVNGDALIDLVIHIATANLDPDYFQDGYAVLTGKTDAGDAIVGRDIITVVPVEGE